MKKISTANDTVNISLTIYNGGFGAVKENRIVNLTGEETELIFSDVAQQIETDSLLVEGLNVLEFNYDYDLVDRSKLLRKYIDKEVYLKHRGTGVKTICRLLSVESHGGCVLEDTATKEIYIDAKEELILPSLPAGLIIKPALVWKIAESRTENVLVSYLSKGFNWNANYVIELMENTLNVVGWAEIENKSGTTFENAKVKLIAGDVKRIEEEDYYRKDYMMIQEESAMPQASEKTFFDYHMYTLYNNTTLKDNQTKQVNILNGGNIPYKKYYRLDKQEEKVNVIIKFENREDCGLGIAMPKGKIKIYKADTEDNSLEFIGEDSIDHTPKDEDIKLNIGNAFDITYICNELEREKINGFEHYKVEYIIKNHKEESAEVHFEHFIWGVWEMISSTHHYKKRESETIEFIIDMQANSKNIICFEYKIDRRAEILVKR